MSLPPSMEKNTRHNKDSQSKFIYAVSLGLELGFLIAAPLVIFVFLGVFLDRKFHTLPLFLITFILLSIITTIFEVRNLILPFLEKRSQNKSTNN